MTDQQPEEPVQSGNVEDVATSTTPPETAPDTPAPDERRDVSKLTAEEQMALFEKNLKEEDWGHQPC